MDRLSAAEDLTAGIAHSHHLYHQSIKLTYTTEGVTAENITSKRTSCLQFYYGVVLQLRSSTPPNYEIPQTKESYSTC
eukprot:scaffold5313_cov174-Amphora_coffeaeformis.AAC.1